MIYQKISILDPSLVSDNLGDELISKYVYAELEHLLASYQKIRIPTHDYIGKHGYKQINDSNFVFVGGSNLLSSNMNEYNQWKINLFDLLKIRSKPILMGVGWWQYQRKPNLYTQILLRNLLNKKYLHSVRDSYTESKLKSMGISNVINTACPTMWSLTKEHCQKIPSQKSKNVIFTLTKYNKNIEKDRFFINTLADAYENVFFWPQDINDYHYYKSLNINISTKILHPTTASYLKFLQSHSKVDYVGTRLHAGIIALNYQVRTLIISIDNRAAEISSDSNIPIIVRDKLESSLNKKIHSDFKTQINIPSGNINRWKNQFK